jgi:uncharacterized protein
MDLHPPETTAVLVQPVPIPGRRRYRALFEVLVCSGFPTQLFVTFLLVALGLRPTTANDHLSLPSFLALGALDALLVVTLVLMFLVVGGERPSQVLLGNRPPLREAWYGVLVAPFIVVLAALLMFTIIGWFPSLEPKGNPFTVFLATPASAVLFGLIAVLAGGAREEIQRAFVLHRFEQHLGGAVVGLVAFSAIFGFGHAIQGGAAVIVTAVLGALWGVVYLRRRSIMAPVVSHAMFNLIEVVGLGLAQ